LSKIIKIFSGAFILSITPVLSPKINLPSSANVLSGNNILDNASLLVSMLAMIELRLFSVISLKEKYPHHAKQIF
jgi:hypothetical protein